MSTIPLKQRVQIEPRWSGEGNLAYLIVNPQTQEAFLIDPDIEILGSLLLELDKRKLTLVAVIDTHNHAEHATAAPALIKLTGAAYLMNHRAPSSYVTDRLNDKDERTLAGIPVTFIHSPGHTPDMQVVLMDGHLFTGDSLFLKSCGRADLPGGDAGQQFDSLKHLMSLPEDTIVHPGHDYNQELSATIGEIKRQNPRVQFTDRETFIQFMADHYAREEKPDDLMYYVGFNAR